MASLSVQTVAFARSVVEARVGSIVTSPPASSSFSLGFKCPYNVALVSRNIRHRKSHRQLSLSRVWKKARGYRIHCSSAPAEGTEEQEKEEREEEEPEYLGELRVPQAWVDPDIAAREAEWLRVALHQWLDDEFCPEPANEEISKRCSKVFYYCLLEQQLDVGDILMQMVRVLESFSFKDSFHGAFSSANAAIDLITKRMRNISLEEKDHTLDSALDNTDSPLDSPVQ